MDRTPAPPISDPDSFPAVVQVPPSSNDGSFGGASFQGGDEAREVMRMMGGGIDANGNVY